MQRHLGLLAQLVDRKNHVRIDHMIEMAHHASKLRVHVLADRGSDVELMAADIEGYSSTPSSVGGSAPAAPRAYSVLLCRTGGISSDSRYFAIVRRATTIPCLPRIF